MCCSHVGQFPHHDHSLQQELDEVFLKLLIFVWVLLCNQRVGPFRKLCAFVLFLLHNLGCSVLFTCLLPVNLTCRLFLHILLMWSFHQVIGNYCVEQMLILLVHFCVFISQTLKQRRLALEHTLIFRVALKQRFELTHGLELACFVVL